MANTTISPNMGMPVPVVGADPGPQYGTDQNSCFSILDSHDHTIGNGVQITPNGMNINVNLPFGGNSATGLLSAVFNSQSAALTGTNFASVVGGNLYFNDGSGNQIPITAGGGVAGSPGSIGSLASPAAATYSAGSKTFIWTANSSKAAAMDNGAVTIRETNVTSAKGITLASPTSLAADYSLTLFTGLPGSTQYVSCDSSGNLGTVSADSIGSAMTSTGANAIIANRTRSVGATVGVGGVIFSGSTGTDVITSTSYVDVTNLTGTITTTGNPVDMKLISDSTGFPTINDSYVTLSNSGAVSGSASILILRGTTQIASYPISTTNTGGNPLLQLPPSIFDFTDFPSAGAYTYKIQAKVGVGSQIEFHNVRFIASEDS